MCRAARPSAGARHDDDCGESSVRETPHASRLVRDAHLLVVALVAVLVLVQAALAGQSDRLFGTLAIGVHGQVANAIFVLVLVNLGLGWRAGVRGARFVVLAALVVTVSIQTGLGYAGRTSLGAAAWHIPTGVAVFGLATASATLSISSRIGSPVVGERHPTSRTR